MEWKDLEETMSVTHLIRMQLEAFKSKTNTAVTIGVLDGVHLGHQALLKCLCNEAQVKGLEPGVITLHPHPITVLKPEITARYLTSLEERITLLKEHGAKWVAPLTFTSELAEMTAEELAEELYKTLGMRLLVLGPDAAFGRGAPQDTVDRMETLGKKIGFETITIKPFLVSDERCSSTRIKKALDEGLMEEVKILLGRYYRLAGPVVHGYERGRTLGYPTANISVAANRFLPALGVYATRAFLQGDKTTYYGATNIGKRPTFDEGHLSIETHLLDYDGNLYDKRMEIELITRIRGEKTFKDLNMLRTQIAEDVSRIRDITND